MGADMQPGHARLTDVSRWQPQEKVAVEESGKTTPFHRKPWLWLGVGALTLVAIVAYTQMKPKAGSKPAAVAAQQAQEKSRVRVLTPGLVQVAAEISVTGSLAAKYELPVGAEGEGGRVSAIRAEIGQNVAAGQVLASLDTSVMDAQVRAMAASVEEARASARLAKADLDRALPVAQSGALSRAELDRRRSALDTSNARVKVMEAQHGEMRAKLARMAIRAPSGGIVLERNVELGQIVGAGSQPLFKLAKNREIELRGQVAEQDMPQLKIGQSVRVSIAGVDKTWTGRIWLLGATIDPQTRLGSVRVALPYDPMLRPGAFARARIESAAVQRPVVPQSAILADGKGTFVYIIGDGNKVERRNVRMGSASDAGVAITEGLNGREAVVISAGPFLRIGEEVDPVPTDAKALQS